MSSTVRSPRGADAHRPARPDKSKYKEQTLTAASTLPRAASGQPSIDDEAEALIDAALNGDQEALKEVVAALEEETEDEADDSDDEAAPATETTATIIVSRTKAETEEHATAAAVLRPTTQAGITAYRLAHYGKTLADDTLAVNELILALRDQVSLVNEKNLDRGTAMLTTQAHTLDALFHTLIRRAIRQEGLPQFEAFMKFALRAQSQCRATWEAISVIQNPPIAGYVGQANIASGPQQVNNETRPSASFDTNTRERARARGNQNQPGRVLEHTQHEPDKWLDPRATATATGADPAVEAVEAFNGAKNPRGESSGRA
jgi:hypothetical protein